MGRWCNSSRSGADWLIGLSLRRAVNEVYLHLLAQRHHAENCTDERCVNGCDVVAFHRVLEAPLLAGDVDMQGRLEQLVRGDIPA